MDVFKNPKLYSDIVWRVVLDVLSRGLVFLINILVARELGPGPFGKFSYVISLSQIFYIFTDLGTHLQLMKEMGEGRGAQETGWILYFELKVMLSILCLVIGSLLSPYLWHWEHAWLVPLALVWMLSNSFLDFSQFLSNGLRDLPAARRFMITQRLFMVAGVLIPVIGVPTLGGIMAGLSVGSLMGTVVSFRNFMRGRTVQFEWFGHARDWGRILWRSLPIGISGALGIWYLRIGVIILGWVATSDLVGEYSAAFRIYEITYVVPAAIMSIGMPHLSRVMKHDPISFRDEFIRLSKVLFFLGAGWGLLLFFGREPLIRVLFGGRYMAAAPVLKILAGASFFVFVNYLITHLMIIFNHQRRHALHLTVVFIICCLLNVVWVPVKGSEAPALVLLVGEILIFLLTFSFLFRRYRKNMWPIGFGTIECYEPS